MKRAIMLLAAAAFAFTLSAADIAGKWKAPVEGPGGSTEVTFMFKVDGAKITGTSTSEMSGEVPLTDVKLDGDNISFTVTMDAGGQEMKILHKGKIAGNEMKLEVTFAGMDMAMQITAKKVT